MADLPQDFWSGWIIVLFGTSFIGLMWLVLGAYFQRDEGHDVAHQPVWDNTLQEGDSPAPLWWFWMILAAMVFSALYLMLYPGLGSFAGALRWSQGGQLREHHAMYELTFADRREALQASSLAELAADPTAMEAAERLFIDNCAACHGAEARGQARLFPNLRDSDWQWGSEPEQIEQTIVGGRSAMMVSWQAALGDEGVDNVARYVQALSAGTASDQLPGHSQYQTFCIACHGPDGAGNQLLGAPRLSDDIWLYGGELDTIKHTLRNGRMGVMPAFGEKLDELQRKLLIAWLLR